MSYPPPLPEWTLVTVDYEDQTYKGYYLVTTRRVPMITVKAYGDREGTHVGNLAPELLAEQLLLEIVQRLENTGKLSPVS